MKKLKRPLAFTGLSLFVALVTVYLFGIFCGVLLAVLAGAALVIQLYLKNNDSAQVCGIALFCAAAAIGLCVADTARTDKVLDNCCAKTVTVTAKITAWRDVGGVTLADAVVTHIDGENTPDFATSFFYGDAFDAGDEISAVVTFDAVRDPYKSSLAIKCRIEALLGVSPAKHKLTYICYSAREYLGRRIRYWLPGENGDIAATVVTGDKSYMNQALLLAFDRAGVSHILVVSGMHITLFISLLLSLLKRIGANRYISLAVLIFMVCGCLLFYGAEASVLRSCVMCCVVYISQLAVRRNDPPTSLALAAIVIFIFDPASAIDITFLLSFGCCFAITVFVPKTDAAIEQKICGKGIVKRLLRGIVKAVAVTTVINLVILPIQVLYGLPVSVVAPLANLAIVLIVPVHMIAAFLIAVPVEFAAGIAGAVTGVCSAAVIAVTRFFASFSLASVSVGAPYLKIWLAFCGAAAAVCFFYKQEKVRARFVAACMALVLLAGILSQLLFTINKPAVTLYRDNVILAQDNGRAFLIIERIDSQGVDYLMSYLGHRYIDEVAYVIITEDIGQHAERHIQQTMPDAIIAACYITNTPGIISYDPVNYVQRMERFDITVFEDKSVYILAGSVRIFIPPRNSESEYIEYDITARRYGSDFIDSYYVIGSRVYRSDVCVVMYINDDGTVKTVAE